MKFIRLISTTTAFLFFAMMIPVYAQHDGQGDKQEKGGGQPRHQPAQPQGRPAPQENRQPQQSQPQRAQQPQQQQPQRAQQPQQQQQQPQRAQQPQQQQPQHVQQQPQQQQQQPQRAQQQQQPQQQQRVQQPPQQRQQPQRAQQPPQRTQQQARSWQQQRGWLQQGGWQGHDSWRQDRAQNWSRDHRTWAQRGGYGGYYIPQQTFGLYFGSQHFFRLGGIPSMYLGYPRFQYGGFSFLLVDPWPEYWSENWYDSDDVYIDYDDGYYLYNRRYPQDRLAITIVL